MFLLSVEAQTQANRVHEPISPTLQKCRSRQAEEGGRVTRMSTAAARAAKPYIERGSVFVVTRVAWKLPM